MNRLRLDGKDFTPSKIVCIGRNYTEYFRELEHETPESMVFSVKPNSVISSTLLSEFAGETLYYEAEICFSVRGNSIEGVGFGLDLARRDLQSTLKKKGLPWERARGFDGAACFSDFVSLGDTEIATLWLKLEVDDKVRQQAGQDLMIHKPDAIIEEIRSFMSLEDGDIVMSGSPKGIGPVQAGEIFVGSVLSGETELVRKEWQAD